MLINLKGLRSVHTYTYAIENINRLIAHLSTKCMLCSTQSQLLVELD